MAKNNVLEYLSLVQSLYEDLDLDQQIYEADDGESSTVDEGKSQAISEVDSAIAKLQEFRTDLKKLSLKALKAKY